MKALILDFGGVVTRTLFETHDLSEAALGLPPGSLAWKGPFDPDDDPLWASMQRDEISERDYWHTRTQEVSALAGREWVKMSEFVRAARGADPSAIIRPEALAAIKKAKAAGLKLAILSNELDLFYGSDLRGKLTFLSEFDVISDATYTNILKPDLRAYQACLNELGIQADQAVFVDDQPRNIVGASAVGMRTVLFDVQKPKASYQAALNMLEI